VAPTVTVTLTTICPPGFHGPSSNWTTTLNSSAPEVEEFLSKRKQASPDALPPSTAALLAHNPRVKVAERRQEWITLSPLKPPSPELTHIPPAQS